MPLGDFLLNLKTASPVFGSALVIMIIVCSSFPVNGLILVIIRVGVVKLARPEFAATFAASLPPIATVGV